jgi:16S rRNA (cytosine1402-N4)-methyltransferase
MRMDRRNEKSAKTVVNEYDYGALIDIFFRYGEERYSKQIARNICLYRNKTTIKTTKQLVEIIENSIPKSKQKDGHPAKRTFQAIRIEVNNEIEPLFNTVKNCISCLNSKGRLCIITFHSLEDRAVKNAMLEAKGKCICPSDLPYCVCGFESLGEVLTKKPIIATEEEQNSNSRSKSAKLRIFEKK